MINLQHVSNITKMFQNTDKFNNNLKHIAMVSVFHINVMASTNLGRMHHNFH